jgi:DNA-binding transcriptional LysR family regulator
MRNPGFPSVLADLHLLTIIAQTRSLTQAARRLGVSKASVSERLRSLEKVAGMALVRRTTRTVALTAQAAKLVEDTRSSFEHIEHSFQQVKDVVGTPRGLVRVTAPVAFGRQKIAPLIAPFLHEYPEIRIELDLSDRLVNLAEHGFDLAIRHASVVPDTYIARVLSDVPSILMASPEYLATRGHPLSPADLSHHSCLLYLRDGPSQSWSFERRGERRRGARVTVPVAGPFKANNSEVLRVAIQGGLGIGLLPAFSSSTDSGNGRLVSVLSEWQPVGFFGEKLFVLRAAGQRAPRAVQCLIDFLRRSLSFN